jgi:hypothetical protein
LPVMNDSAPAQANDPYSPQLSADELAKLKSPDVPREESVFGSDFDQRAGEIAADLAAGNESHDVEPLIDTEIETDGGQELQEQADGKPDGQQIDAETSKVTVEKPWATQTVRDVAASYGISEEEFESFGSLEQLESFQNKLDQHIAQWARVSQSPDVGQQPQNNQQAAVQQQQQPPTPAAAPVTNREGFKDGKIDIDYFKKNYDADDPILAVVEHANAMEQTMLQQTQLSQEIVKRLAEQEQHNQTAMFHSAVDAYNPDFFGRAFDKTTGQPGALGAETTKRRDQLLEYTLNYVLPSLEMRRNNGLLKTVPGLPEVIHQAARALFGKEMDALHSQRKQSAMKAQAAKKRSVGTAAPGLRPGIAPRNGRQMSDFEKLNSNPDLLRQWDEVKANIG